MQIWCAVKAFRETTCREATLAYHRQVPDEEDFAARTYEHTMQIAEHIAPLVLPTGDDISAARLTCLSIRLSWLCC